MAVEINFFFLELYCSYFEIREKYLDLNVDRKQVFLLISFNLGIPCVEVSGRCIHV